VRVWGLEAGFGCTPFSSVLGAAVRLNGKTIPAGSGTVPEVWRVLRNAWGARRGNEPHLG
jgi:hypothetical protein